MPVGYEDLLRLGVPFLLGLVVGGYLRRPVQVLLTVGGVLLAGYVWLYPEAGSALLNRAMAEAERGIHLFTRWAVWALGEVTARPEVLVVWAETLVKSVPPMWAFWAGFLGGVRG